MTLSRGERLFVALFVALNVAVPLLARDLYPFSVFPMFSKRPLVLSRVEVRGPDGELLPPEIFDTLELDVFVADPRVGFLVTSLDPGNRPLEADEVQSHLKRVLREREIDLAFVDAEQTLTSIGTNGDVVTTTLRWRVENDG